MNRRTFLISTAVAVAGTTGLASAQHHHHSESTPEAHDHGMHMSATPTAANMSTGAFYFTVINHADEADTLLGVTSDAAETLEVHNVEMTDGVMKMSPQHDGVEIPAHGELMLAPGSYHVMMIGLTESLLDGEEFTAILHFEKAGDVEIVVPIFMLEPKDDDAEPIKVGDELEITHIWARQAPKLDGEATPTASPDATPDE